MAARHWVGVILFPITVGSPGRLAEIRRLLDDEPLRDRAVLARRVGTVAAYEQQSASYDAEAGGGLFAADEPCIAATYRHQLGDYLRAALGVGLQVRRCEEPAGRPPESPCRQA